MVLDRGTCPCPQLSSRVLSTGECKGAVLGSCLSDLRGLIPGMWAKGGSTLPVLFRSRTLQSRCQGEVRWCPERLHLLRWSHSKDTSTWVSDKNTMTKFLTLSSLVFPFLTLPSFSGPLSYPIFFIRPLKGFPASSFFPSNPTFTLLPLWSGLGRPHYVIPWHKDV